MKTRLLVCGALAALLLPISMNGQAPGPRANGPRQAEMQRLRDQLLNLPPAQRRALLRDLQDQPPPAQTVPGARPYAMQPGNPPPGPAAAPVRPGAGPNRINEVLTAEQRRSFREATQETLKEGQELQEKIREARKAVTEATYASKFKESNLRKKLQAAAKLETDLAILRARAISKIDPPLSEEQIEWINNPPPRDELQGPVPPGGVQRPSLQGRGARNNPAPAARAGRQGLAAPAPRPPAEPL
jgi:uncharacterized membrane protein